MKQHLLPHEKMTEAQNKAGRGHCWMLKLFPFPLYVVLNRKRLLFSLFKRCFDSCKQFHHPQCTVQHNINSRRRLFCTGSKNMSEQSQVEQLPQTWCLIHPSDPFSPEEPGKHPAWHIWRLCPWVDQDRSAEYFVASPDQTGVLPRTRCPGIHLTAHAATCRRSAATVATSLMRRSLISALHHSGWHTLVVLKNPEKKNPEARVCLEGKSNTSNLCAVTAVCPVWCLLISISYR